MTHLYEYEIVYADGRDSEIVETTAGPHSAEEELREQYPEAERIVYVGRVA